MHPISIDDKPLTLEQIDAVARGRQAVEIGPAARRRIEDGRRFIEMALAEDRPVYGLTRGLGARVTTSVDPAERAEMSHIMLRARACGSGPSFPQDAIRAFLLARLASMGQGRSGVRLLLAERLAEMLNRGVHPLVHEIGAHGASDLPLTAELGLPVMGEGRVYYGDELLPAAEGLARAGLEPLILKEKEGLGLCSASSVSAGLGALVLHDARQLLALAEATAVLSFEAFRANLSPIDPRVVAAHPAPGQAEAAAALHAYLKGSALTEPGAARRVQDPISLRCASHAFAGLHAALTFAEPYVMAEINGSGDNPIVLYEDDEVLSTGNFQTIGLAHSFDLLGIALYTVASMGSQRTGRLMRKTYTDLNDGLSRHPDSTVRIGMGLLGHNARHVAKEIQVLAQPASLSDDSGYEVEDHEPMTPLAVRSAWHILPLWRQILAAELIVAAEAFDQRQPSRPAAVAVALRDAVRAEIPPFEDDRSHSEDLERVSALIESGALFPLLAAE